MAVAAQADRPQTWREKYWPVEDFERKKVIPMIVMMFLICFNYTLLRDLKDIHILKSMPASAITFLKLGGVLPASVIVMLLYTKMSMSMSKTAIFYSWTSMFIAYFAIFGAVLYPLQHHISGQEAWVEAYSGPEFLEGVVAIAAYWPLSLFYIMSELWGTVVLSLLFWGFANDICRTHEAKRFYTLFNIGANVSLLAVGVMYIVMGTMEKARVAAGGDPKAKSSSDVLNYILMGTVVVFGVITLAIYRWMHKNVLTDPRLFNPNETRKGKKKPKLSLGESLKMMFTSPYIALIGVMVVLYGLSVNMIEIFYKSAWKDYFGKGNDGAIYQFQGSFSLCTGFVALNLLLFVAGRAVRVLGWTWTALVTPAIIGVAGLPFLILYSISEMESVTIALLVIVIFGFISVVLSKACKYAFFDPTKEMTYIPLGAEMRGRAKAAVDVTGARFGKSGGGLVQTFLLACYQTKEIKKIVVPATAILVVSVIVWFIGTLALGKRYIQKDAEFQAEQKKADNEEVKDAVELGQTSTEDAGADLTTKN